MGHSYFAYWFCLTWVRSPMSCLFHLCVCLFIICLWDFVQPPLQLESTHTSCVVVRDNETRTGLPSESVAPTSSSWMFTCYAASQNTAQTRAMMVIFLWEIKRRQEDRETLQRSPSSPGIWNIVGFVSLLKWLSVPFMTKLPFWKSSIIT